MKKLLILALLPFAAFANPCTATFTGNCNASTGNQTVQGQSQGQGQSESQGQTATGGNSNASAVGGTSTAAGGSATGTGGAVSGSGNSSNTVSNTATGGTGGSGGAGGTASSKAASTAVATQGNTQVSNSNYSYGPPPVINPIRIVQCGVAIDAGGSGMKGAGALGMTFTTEECWNSNYAAMEEGAGRFYDACVMRRLSKTEQRAIKNGAKFEDCIPTPPVVVEKVVYVDRPVEVIKYVDRAVNCVTQVPRAAHKRKIVSCVAH